MVVLVVVLSVNVDAVMLPIEYKYVIIDDKTNALVAWEEGDNRTTEGLLPPDHTAVPDGTVLVAYGESLRVKEQTWRAAGVVIPVFSLRSTHLRAPSALHRFGGAGNA